MMTMVNASARLSAWLATITAIATVIEPVGPEMSERVPPNTAAKKPTEIAPYIPAAGPSSAPNTAKPKASATGRLTTAAVMPPMTSPRRVCRLYPCPEIKKRLSKWDPGGGNCPCQEKRTETDLRSAQTCSCRLGPMTSGVGDRGCGWRAGFQPELRDGMATGSLRQPGRTCGIA